MTEQLHLFEAAVSHTARDDVMTKLAANANPWLKQALDAITPEFKKNHPQFTGEMLRVSLSLRIDAPHHVNAWGLLVMHLVKGKVIKRTGKWVSMASKSSHARQTPVYFWA